ncbi:putative transcriptional regulator, AsnC family [Haloterrigena turkmenica DSM 5511]|uniref:Transcriptional regulator, AsnC family n=1 Tax=Haloterrigena turkmenica (strain ATCC 51198 / DSM 5511 / JCM 9101 / NCIMB 13204 / VKM B-1734 / 4k) TaxID=543526 RepID=D2RZI7_HALTV|nr:Lrp/AsnC family transcriptional regulator [Haloterrigena turkmenica]ADB62026.1 putative transcriptional regulator, AsnC family [Haloterrigena turkmenica DSM 5511]
MDYRLDEIDRRIIHELMSDSRNVSAPTIADEVNVSPGTIRNRISKLEANGIITGYHATVDFERADGRLANLFMCNAPVSERETIAQQARIVAGVVNVRELMTGRRNLHVLAVGADTDDLRRIARSLSDLGLEIEDEVLVQNEMWQPYAPFGPDEGTNRERITDFVSLSGDAEVAEVTVDAEAPIADLTLEHAVRQEILPEESLVIAIERGDTVLTPHGDTTIRADDIVTVFSRGGIGSKTLDALRRDGPS